MRLKRITETDETSSITILATQNIEIKLASCLNATYSSGVLENNQSLSSKVEKYIKMLINDIIVYDNEIVSVIRFKIEKTNLMGTPEYQLRFYVKDPFAYFKMKDEMFAEFTFDLADDFSVSTYLKGLDNCRYIDEREQYGGKPFYTVSSEIKVHKNLIHNLKIVDECLNQDGSLVKQFSTFLLDEENEQDVKFSIFKVSVYEKNFVHGFKFESEIMAIDIFGKTLELKTKKFKGLFTIDNMNKMELSYLKSSVRSIFLMQEEYNFDESFSTESMLKILEMALI